MATMTIYLDDETLARVEKAARRENLSLSRWAREHLSEAATERPAWPEDYFNLFGALDDDTFEAPPELAPADDAPRLDLDG